jgi:uncharacterized protein
MATKIFVNTHVKDLKRSMDFFKALGYSFNMQFTNDSAACLVITEDIYAMLITHDRFKDFTPKKISDATQTTEVLLALSCESREKVDELYTKAIKAGATETRPAEDHGFMYGRSFNDPDGHIWELFWMDPKGIPAQ